MGGAYLWSHGDILDLLDAVDPLQDYAVRSGLVASIGQDRFELIIDNSFAIYRRADHV